MGDNGGPSERELVVLQAIADGRTNMEVAEGLVISPATVARRVANLRAKTGSRDRFELIRWARLQGLLGDD